MAAWVVGAWTTDAWEGTVWYEGGAPPAGDSFSIQFFNGLEERRYSGISFPPAGEVTREIDVT